MEVGQGKEASWPDPPERPHQSPAEEPDLPERWSLRRKMGPVLRLLRGKPPDAVSRDSQVPAHTLENWQPRFLDAGIRGLRSQREPEERELALARAKIGELMMRLELAEGLIEKMSFTDEWKRYKA